MTILSTAPIEQQKEEQKLFAKFVRNAVCQKTILNDLFWLIDVNV